MLFIFCLLLLEEFLVEILPPHFQFYLENHVHYAAAQSLRLALSPARDTGEFPKGPQRCCFHMTMQKGENSLGN